MGPTRSGAPDTSAIEPRASLVRALNTDLRRVLQSRVLLAFLALEVVAATLLVLRRGEAIIGTVALVWAAFACVALLAWWAGRDAHARTMADPVPMPAWRAAAALAGALGILLSGMGAWFAGAPILIAAVAAWLGVGMVAARRGAMAGPGWRQLLRDPRPFIPLLLLVGLTRFLFGGITPVGLVAALLSGVIQQVAYLVGLLAPLEAAHRRTDVAAVLAALAFGAVHLPFNLEPNGGDWVAAAANAVLFQASVGLIACLAFVRHRAALPIGLAHGLAIS
jgi:hypothetical protein